MNSDIKNVLDILRTAEKPLTVKEIVQRLYDYGHPTPSGQWIAKHLSMMRSVKSEGTKRQTYELYDPSLIAEVVDTTC